MGIPLLQGREFSREDVASTPRVTIISEAMARMYFPNQNPIGKRLIFGFPPHGEAPREIIGVVGNVRDVELRQAPAAMMYVPFAQAPFWGTVVVVRTNLSVAAVAEAIRRDAHAIDKDLPVTDIGAIPELVDATLAQPRFQTLLLGLFSGLALTLAAVGIYGVISYSVIQRTHEIGIRMSLGAQPSQVLRLVMGQGAKLALAGIAVGIAAALALTRLMRSLLFEVSPAGSVDVCRDRSAARRGRLGRLLHPGAARNARRPNDCTALRIAALELDLHHPHLSNRLNSASFNGTTCRQSAYHFRGRRSFARRNMRALAQRGGKQMAESAATEHERMIGVGWMESFWMDLRYGLRTLQKNRGFAAVAILTLALGIGANTAIFSAVNAVLLRPLPFKQPDRLVQLWETETEVPQAPFAAPDFVDWRAQNQTFEDMTLYTWPNSLNMSGTGEPEHIYGILAQANFFSVLGSTPLMGRTFVTGEDQAGHNHVAVLSYGLWQRRFGGTRDVLGKDIELGGEKYQIVGVMPEDFRIGLRADLWIPIDMDLKKLPGRGEHSYPAIGRLKPGVTAQQAKANLNAIAKRLEEQYPDSNRKIGADVVEMREQLTGNVRPALLVLLGAVALVLLIACVNVANLLLARASSRQREIALRSALGAARSRIIRQLLTESVLLSFLAAIPGILLAYWGVALLKALPSVPGRAFEQISVDGVVLCFALGIAVFTGLVFGLAPALQVGARDLHDDLKSGGKGAGAAASSSKWLRNSLVVGEIALSLCLLIAAGLLLRTFERLRVRRNWRASGQSADGESRAA